MERVLNSTPTQGTFNPEVNTCHLPRPGKAWTSHTPEADHQTWLPSFTNTVGWTAVPRPHRPLIATRLGGLVYGASCLDALPQPALVGASGRPGTLPGEAFIV